MNAFRKIGLAASAGLAITAIAFLSSCPNVENPSLDGNANIAVDSGGGRQ